jgi:nucleoside-diphosphate-sugar epimerase
MYDPKFLNGMTEQTPINPSSQKGKVRAAIANMIMTEVKAGTLTALIARSADFYGPSIKNSMLAETVIKNLAKGSSAFWLGGLNYKHSFTYTPDAAKATALLGNTSDAFNQVWHLPTATNPPIGKEWVALIAKELEVKPKVMSFPKWMIKLMGLFMPIMKEMVEMLYQYDRDYVFNSTKFEERFKVKPTSYKDGIKEIIAKDYTKVK